ncbi:MAG: hypothetical protein D6722_16680, partial [Bacteroidetes bacterium]
MRAFSFILLFGLIGSALPGQSLSEDSLRARYARDVEQRYQEVCYLHLPRRQYLSGEHGWFGVLVTSGLTREASPLSRVAYVEVINREGNPVWQGKIGLKDGLGEGRFELPDGLASDHYLLRAYTRWMRNGDPGLFFSTWIQVVNPQLPPRRHAAP